MQLNNTDLRAAILDSEGLLSLDGPPEGEFNLLLWLQNGEIFGKLGDWLEMVSLESPALHVDLLNPGVWAVSWPSPLVEE